MKSSSDTGSPEQRPWPGERRLALAALVSLSLLLGLLTARRAEANGRYPASGLIALHPTDDGVLLVRATYGLLLSTDGGGSWGWACEAAAGVTDNEDPMVSFSADGRILAGTFGGLSVGSPDGCQWVSAKNFEGSYVADLAVDKSDPTRGILVVNDLAPVDGGSPAFVARLWRTTDAGTLWAPLASELPVGFFALTVDSAPSNPKRFYASGRRGELGALQRTDDGGAAWLELPIPGADGAHLPYIGGVDPVDPDVLYVRLDADGNNTLLLSRDGGESWKTILSVAGKMSGFAISPDGATVAASSPGVAGVTGTAGLWTAPSSTLEFSRVSDVGALCLSWGRAGLYACGNEPVDGFSVGVSLDQGRTFTPRMLQRDLAGPIAACGPATSVGARCPPLWPRTQATLGATPDPQNSAGASGAGGTASGLPGAREESPTAHDEGSCTFLSRRLTGDTTLLLVTLGAVVGWVRRGQGRRSACLAPRRATVGRRGARR